MIVDCGLWIVDCGLWIVDCGLWIVDCGFITKPHKVGWALPTIYVSSISDRISIYTDPLIVLSGINKATISFSRPLSPTLSLAPSLPLLKIVTRFTR